MIQGINKNRPSFQEISKLTPFHGWVFVRNKTEIIVMCGHSWKSLHGFLSDVNFIHQKIICNAFIRYINVLSKRYLVLSSLCAA